MLSYARRRLASWVQIVRLLRVAGAPLLAGAFVLQILGGVVPVAFIVATSAVVGRVPAAVEHGLGSPEWRSLRDALLLTGALFLVQQVVWPAQWAVGEEISWRVDDAVRERVVAASFDPVGIAALEDQETLDELAQIVNPLRGFGFTPGSACAGLTMLVRRYLQWALAAILVGIVFAWWAALAAAAGALGVRVATRTGLGRLGAIEASHAPARRRRDYFRDLLLEGGPAKEVRVFGLLPWLQTRYRTQALDAVRPVWKARRRIVYRRYLVTLPIAVVLSGLATVAAARAAAHGDLSLAEMTFVLQAVVLVAMLGEFAYESDYQTEFGLQAYDAVERLEERASSVRPAEGGDADPAGRPCSEIRFEDVWFTYSGAAQPALRGVTLTIPAGRSLAIVGLNGAGKTTLVKLLARLYEPERGRIAVDGVDVRRFPPLEWQRRLAAIFQDFVHYDLSVADNVALGGVGRDGDRLAAVLAAAGARSFVEALPHGTATILSREYEGGTDLSGGQWQRIALARALAAVDAGAGVLVLDEPTANLDVRAEAELFDRLLEVTGGVTTILISHRFSTVRRAERIVVLEEGKVVEEGTHASLLERGGRYARLFRLQAARFGGESGEEPT